MSKNIGNILKQAQKMQEKMAEIQQEVAAKTIEASSGGGMVTATVNGKQEVVSITIDPAVVNSDDVEMLQDLIIAAVNEGLKCSQQILSEEMGKVTGGLGMNIPGLF
ncbi:MAG: YbaB/EbfC family nucleoid-associated protein [Thermodesulfobacteriota bacterium]